MLVSLLQFEWSFFSKKISTYLLFVGFAILGFLAGNNGMSFPSLEVNGSYSVSFLVGLLSLTALIPITMVSASSINREIDANFEGLLYTTSIQKRDLLLSRWLVIASLSSFVFLLLIVGLALGQYVRSGSIHPQFYIHAFLLFGLPNIIFCSTLVTAVGWWTRNKLMVFLSGLLIYILYIIVQLFSNSPMMANASPVSAEAMSIAAQLDPFGMAPFFEQTHHWTNEQRNTQLIALKGYMLQNRLSYFLFSLGLLITSIYTYSFRSQKSRKNKIEPKSTPYQGVKYQPAFVENSGMLYALRSISSLAIVQIKSIFKGIPIYLMLLAVTFLLGIEMFSQIDSGMRIPQRFATSALLINSQLASLPIVTLFAMLFFGSDIVWKSPSANFHALEGSTPISKVQLLCSHLAALLSIPFMLMILASSIALGVQAIYDYPTDWRLYSNFMLFYSIPALPIGIVIIGIFHLTPNRYVGMVIGLIILLLTNTKIGLLFGFSHPLLRFATFMPDVASDINGFGHYATSFGRWMMYSLSIALTFIGGVIYIKNGRKHKQLLLPSLGIICCSLTGFLVSKDWENVGKAARLDWQEGYERVYRKYQDTSRPSVTNVETWIDMYPSENRYTVQANYQLKNHSNGEIAKFLLAVPRSISLNELSLSESYKQIKDDVFGQHLITLSQPLGIGDSLTLSFKFSYEIPSNNEHDPLNTIVNNGAFMRISNYFPRLGYQDDLEISDEIERKKRRIGSATPLTTLESPIKNPYHYSFIILNMHLSTDAGHQAVGTGSLAEQYKKDGRNHFRYQSEGAVPFRFAVASGNYAVASDSVAGHLIEVYYHPEHGQNVDALVSGIKETMTYCERNFSPYPYKAIRFAEISSFTQGFAATAYPGVIFMNESTFHLDITADKQQDIINQLAGHELSHEWWGVAQLIPENREGGKALTETLAMYTELMRYKQAHGRGKMEEMVSLFRELYESSKGFSENTPLYKVRPEDSNVAYNKGLLVMFEIHELIGEEKINRALKQLLSKHAYPKPPATSLDLIEALCEEANTAERKQIEALFKVVEP